MRVLLTVLYLSYMGSILADNIVEGKKAYQNHNCIMCHSIGSEGNSKMGPNLQGIGKLRSDEWLTKWLKAPESMKEDPEVKEMIAKYRMLMPNLHLSDEEIKNIIDFLKSK